MNPAIGRLMVQLVQRRQPVPDTHMLDTLTHNMHVHVPKKHKSV
jgi:hypothetical protein